MGIEECWIMQSSIISFSIKLLGMQGIPRERNKNRPTPGNSSQIMSKWSQNVPKKQTGSVYRQVPAMQGRNKAGAGISRPAEGPHGRARSAIQRMRRLIPRPYRLPLPANYCVLHLSETERTLDQVAMISD